jgi:protocatechuate 3,4-dioxygenase beta subunit
VRHITILLLLGVTRLAAQSTPSAANSSEDEQLKKLAKVEGKTVNSVSGTGIGKVTITMRSFGSSKPLKYVATSDAEGSFVIDRIEPGRYTFSAEKAGFLKQLYGTPRATPLTLSESQLMKEVLFKLTPQGVIAGRVIDETGEPMNRVQISAMRWAYSRGKRSLQPFAGGFTNDIGEFRIANLAPGSYCVQARGGDLIAGVLPFTHADAPSAVVPEAPEESYVPTYYPSTVDPAGAAMLQVAPGAVLREIEIQARKSRVFRVRGRVVDGATGLPVTDASVMLSPASANYGLISGMSSMGGPRIRGGVFEALNVLPGSYYATAEVPANGQALYARQTVEVVNRNVLDVVMRVPRAIDVSGRVIMAGQSTSEQTFKPEKIRVDLSPAEGFGIGTSSPVGAKPDGSFVLRDVVPDKYRVLFGGAPPGAYLKSIRAGGQERPDGIVDLNNGSSIEIVLAMGAAHITGAVVEADDKPAAGAKVTLVPDDASLHRRMDLFRNTLTDQSGKFNLDKIVPGRYKIFAWDELESDAAEALEFFQMFDSKAISIALDDNGSENVQLKAISADEVAKAFGYPPNH